MLRGAFLIFVLETKAKWFHFPRVLIFCKPVNVCVSFPPFGPVTPGSSQEAKSQTCFGKKREDVFLSTPPSQNVIILMISSHLIIVSNIISHVGLLQFFTERERKML